MDGSTSQEALDEVARLVEQHPVARVLLAFDNDAARERVKPHTGEVIIIPPAGQQQPERVAKAIRDRVPAAQIEQHFPPAAYQDWNDCLLNVNREQADEARLAAQAEAAAATRAAHIAEELQARAPASTADAAGITSLRRELRDEIESGSLTRDQVIQREQGIERRAAELERRRREEEAAIRAALEDIEQQGQRNGLRR